MTFAGWFVAIGVALVVFAVPLSILIGKAIDHANHMEGHHDD